jgi:hypothetical protein
MYTGAGATKSDNAKLDEAFARSRGASIVLGITAGFTAVQAGMLFLNLPPGVIDAAAAGEEAAATALGMAAYVTLYCLLALTCALFAWLMRSRVAMAIGLIPFALNWLDFVLVLMAGQLPFAGLLMNVAGPVFIVRSIFYATRYHSMKRRKTVDPEVFA